MHRFRLHKIQKNKWVEAIVKKITPYAGLARWRNPTGVYLLFFPCCWGLAVTGTSIWSALLYLKFFVESVLMRGAGCTLNDILDRHFDAQVERTKNRPLPSGTVSVKQAWTFLGIQVFLSFLLVLTFHWETILGAGFSLFLVAAYPFAKRVTYFPQVFLGLVFNWGVLLGALESQQRITKEVLLVYIFGILWTVLYDTIYAFQDFKDDAKAGVKSLTFVVKPYAKVFLLSVWAVCIVLLSFLGALKASSFIYYFGVLGTLILVGYDLLKLDIHKTHECLRFFKKCVFFNILFYILLSWS